MTEEEQGNVMTLKDEAHAARVGSIFTLALQLVNTVGLAIVLIAIYQFGEWKGSVDTKLNELDAFRTAGSRFTEADGRNLSDRINFNKLSIDRLDNKLDSMDDKLDRIAEAVAAKQ